MAERVVLGSSMAALVAADSLAAAGHEVLLLAPEKAMGGGFGSMRQGDRVLELGVRLLELSYEGSSAVPPLSSYVPGPAGHRPYVPLVRDYVEELVGPRLQEIGRPQMFYDGRIVDDLYFTTDASVLRGALNERTREMIHAEASAARLAAGHDAGLLAVERVGELDGLDLAQASLRNHGATFHRLFMEPVAEKFVDGGCARVLAALRRKIWLPLFWPLTLAQAVDSGPVQFAPDRPFHTVRDGGAGEVVAALLHRLSERGVTVRPCAPVQQLRSGGGGTTTVALADGTEIVATRPVVGLAAGALFGAAGVEYQAEQARTVLCWLEVADDDILELPALLNIVDADIPAVRVSANGLGSPGHHVLTVELRHDLDEADIAAAARKSVERSAILRPGAEMVELRSGAVSTFALPTADNAHRFDIAAAELAQRQLDIEIVGAGLGFGADALGEQIIQGLRAAEVLTA